MTLDEEYENYADFKHALGQHYDSFDVWRNRKQLQEFKERTQAKEAKEDDEQVEPYDLRNFKKASQKSVQRVIDHLETIQKCTKLDFSEQIYELKKTALSFTWLENAKELEKTNNE